MILISAIDFERMTNSKNISSDTHLNDNQNKFKKQTQRERESVNTFVVTSIANNGKFIAFFNYFTDTQK